MSPFGVDIPGSRRVVRVAYESASQGATAARKAARWGISAALDAADSLGLGLRLDDNARPQLPARVEAREGAAQSPPAQSPPASMEDLLRRSLRQTPAESREELHRLLLGELAPDEARIVAFLGAGRGHALLHVAEPGRDGRRVLENASNIGREAAVTVPELTSAYIRRLLTLGLVEIGPEDHSLREQYEILVADATVRDAIESAGGRGPRRPKISRHTLRISPLGSELWQTVGGAGANDD